MEPIYNDLDHISKSLNVYECRDVIRMYLNTIWDFLRLTNRCFILGSMVIADPDESLLNILRKAKHFSFPPFHTDILVHVNPCYCYSAKYTSTHRLKSNAEQHKAKNR